MLFIVLSKQINNCINAVKGLLVMLFIVLGKHYSIHLSKTIVC